MTFAPFVDTTVPSGERQLLIRNYVYSPEPLGDTSVASGPHDTNSGAEAPANGYEEVFGLEGQMPGGYLLAERLSVRVIFVGTEFVAEQRRLDLHAFGDTAIEAVLNLRERVVQHYRRLEELGERLSPRLKEQRRLMGTLLLRENA